MKFLTPVISDKKRNMMLTQEKHIHEWIYHSDSCKKWFTKTTNQNLIQHSHVPSNKNEKKKFLGID